MRSDLGRHLAILDQRYSDLLEHIPPGTEIVAGQGRLTDICESYTRHGFSLLRGVVAKQTLEALVEDLWPIVSSLAFPIRLPHEIRPDGQLGGGGRLRRVDAASLDDSDQRAALAEVMRAIGLTSFGSMLSDRLTPVVREIVGQNVDYERLFLNLYGEDDYLSAHDDAHMEDRIDVNLSATLDGVGGIRVLTDGNFVTNYDGLGAVTILGPRVWHEVPALLRAPGGPEPRRMTITLRHR